MIFRIAIATILALVSFTSRASVIKELDGVFYEWLELTETQGLSRESVETLLADQDSALYGYQYASKELVEKLFLSYASWDGLNGYHGDASVINGSLAFLNDFGVTGSAWSLGYESAFHTVDGYTIYYDGSYIFNRGLYGTGTECSRNQTNSCLAEQFVQFNLEGDGVMAWQHQDSGWDSDNYFTTKYAKIYPNPSHGSYLVKASVIPIPAAAWLFCSALIALIMAPGCRSNPLTPTNVARR